MSKKILPPTESWSVTQPSQGDLVTRLADELRADRAVGQPMIYERTFDSGLRSVAVVWDAWGRLPLEVRTSTILAAHSQVEGREQAANITLANGLTVPEAVAAGWLPYQVIAAWRQGDPVSLEQCREAMIRAGASTLGDPDHPVLRFATQEDAEAAIEALVADLPGSEPVWQIARDVVPSGGMSEW